MVNSRLIAHNSSLCHARPKINFCQLRIFIYFAISEIAISTILLIQSEKYFLLSTLFCFTLKNHRLVF